MLMNMFKLAFGIKFKYLLISNILLFERENLNASDFSVLISKYKNNHILVLIKRNANTLWLKTLCVNRMDCEIQLMNLIAFCSFCR